MSSPGGPAAASTPEEFTLTRSNIYDLFALDREARNATGFGFFPPAIAKVFEKAALLGLESVNPDVTKAAFDELLRARDDLTIFHETVQKADSPALS